MPGREQVGEKESRIPRLRVSELTTVRIAPVAALIEKLEIAGLTARLAVHQAIGTDADVLGCLTQAAVLNTLAKGLQLVAL